jgi:hypothetical protein
MKTLYPNSDINSRHVLTDGYLVIYSDSTYVWLLWEHAP